MGVAALFDLWKAELAPATQAVCSFGARSVAKHSTARRLAWAPSRDTFGPRRGQGQATQPREIYSRAAGVDLLIVAEDYAAIEGAQGLLDVALSALHKVAAGSFAVESGEWLDDSGATATRGVAYVCRLSIYCPVLQAEDTTQEIESVSTEAEVAEVSP